MLIIFSLTDYSATEYKTDDFAPGTVFFKTNSVNSYCFKCFQLSSLSLRTGMMNLQSVGLQLETDIFHEESDTRAFVATNVSPQVDGDADSVIVVAFRGTVSTTNLKTDFDWGQELLSDSYMTGSNVQAEYELEIHGNSILDDYEYGTIPQLTLTRNRNNVSKKFRHKAKGLLKATPITRQAFPCVHKGFSYAYAQIREEIMESIIKVYERQLLKALERCNDGSALKLPKVYLTGHSLGMIY